MSIFAVVFAVITYVIFALARYKQHLQRKRGDDC